MGVLYLIGSRIVGLGSLKKNENFIFNLKVSIFSNLTPLTSLIFHFNSKIFIFCNLTLDYFAFNPKFFIFYNLTLTLFYIFVYLFLPIENANNTCPFRTQEIKKKLILSYCFFVLFTSRSISSNTNKLEIVFKKKFS
ncbi:hypothetical protein HanIR_Chr13g0664591 [Helianthus annuus]|nr:hypothetical protein HanIR_Chr13g0664591 [Helianthus annuus]